MPEMQIVWALGCWHQQFYSTDCFDCLAIFTNVSTAGYLCNEFTFILTFYIDPYSQDNATY